MPALNLLHDSYNRTRITYERVGFQFRPARVYVSRGLFEALRDELVANERLLLDAEPGRELVFRNARVLLGSNSQIQGVEGWMDDGPLHRLVVPQAENWGNFVLTPDVEARVAQQAEPEPEVWDVDFS